MVLCSGLVYWDMPYGLDVANWDTLLSDSHLDMFFRQLAIINSAPSHALVLHTHYKDAGRVQMAMEKHGYQHVHPLYVYKPTQNQVGTNQFIFAVDQLLVGFIPNRNDIRLNFADPNPTQRHNLIFSHAVTSRSTSSSSSEVAAPVNITQKHTCVSQYIGGVFCTPGGKVLVIGAGSGSELIGFNRAGLEVVALEKDAHQFKGCQTRLLSEQSAEQKNTLTARKELKQMTRLQQVASKFAMWEPEDAPADDVVQPPVQPQKKPKQSVSTCVACGSELKGDIGSCASITCNVRQIHIACLIAHPNLSDGGCEHKFCSVECADKHDCLSRPKEIDPPMTPEVQSKKRKRGQKP